MELDNLLMCTKRALYLRAFCMFGHVCIILFLIFKTTITGITKIVKNGFLSFLFFLFSSGRDTEVIDPCIMLSWKISMFNWSAVGLLMPRKTTRRLRPVP